MSIARLAVKRPVTTAMAFIAITLLGVFSYSRLAIDLLPDVSFPSINIVTSYTGVAPEEIESLITVPIEQAVSTVSGVTGINSLSQQGSSRVTLHFAWGTDLDSVMNDVRANVERVRSRLPEGADAPRVFRFDPSQFPIMTLGLSGDMDVTDLRRIAEDEIVYYLERIEGVAAVDVQGGQRREIKVELDPLRLQAHGLTMDQVVQALQAENLNSPAGQLQVGQAQFTLRTLGEFKSVDELRSVVVANRDGVQTYLEDVAVIREGTDEQGTIVRVDGLPGVVLSIQKQSGANTVQVADAVYRTIEELRQRYPQMSIRPLNDSSTFIRLAVKNVVQAGLFGGALAMLILLVFLRNVRSTLAIGVVIPVSIIAAFILIERAGMTLNTISLGGLALGIGMLVDNSIVVLENIYRHRVEGKDPETAAIVGTGEMTSAIVASTLTTLAVFLPLMFVTGMTGILFRQLSLMVAFTLSCSLLAALTLLPMMCSRLFRTVQAAPSGRLARIDRWLEQLFVRQEAAYGATIERAMKRPGFVAGVAVLLLAGSIALIPYLGSDFLPEGDAGELRIWLRLPTGTRLELTDQVVREVEAIVRERVPELKALDARAGGGGGRSTHMGTVNVTLVPSSQRTRSTDEIAAMLREELGRLPGVTVRVSTGGGFAQRLASGNFSTSGGDRISLNVQGFDRERLYEAANEIQAAIAQIPGVVNASISRDEEQPEFVIRVDRQRAADLGLSTRQISSAVQTALQGRVATRLHIDGEEQSVRVVMAGAEWASPADVESLPIPLPGGGYVLLRSVARLETQESPAAVERINQQRTVTVTASPEGRDLGSVIADIRAAVNSLSLPAGVTVHYGGEYEEQQRAFRELLVVLLLAVSLVYVVMAAQFESLFTPLIVMFSVPFALVGVVLTLLLTGTPLNTQAFMGMIMLAGIVVNNAIVLVTYIELLLERGMSLDEAIVVGTRTRLRPILMTTGTTVLGLTPLALALGEGSEMQMPLARTVIGGLTVSTLVTLILIPTLYRWGYQVRRRWLGAREGAVADSGAGPEPVGAAGAERAGAVTMIVLVTALLTASSLVSAAEASVMTPAASSRPLSSPILAAEPGDGAFKREPVPTPAGVPIAWQDVLRRVRESNPAVREAMTALELAESRLRQQEAAYGPKVDLDASWTRSDPLPGAGGSTRDRQIVSVTATQVLATGPSLGMPNVARDLAALDVDEARVALADERERAVLAALTAYVELLKAQTEVDVATRALARAQEAAEAVALRYGQGMASAVDMEDARIQVRRARLAVEQAHHRLQMAQAGLSEQMDADLTVPWRAEPLPALAAWETAGSSPIAASLATASASTAVVPSSTSGSLHGERDDLIPAGDVPEVDLQRAMRQRIEVVRARYQLARLEAQVRGRVSGFAPVWELSAGVTGSGVRAGVSWDSRNRDTTLSVGANLHRRVVGPSSDADRENEWNVGVAVRWPLYDGGIEEERSLQEALELENRKEALRRQERAVALQVRDAYFSRYFAREAIAVAEGQLANAEARLEQALVRYEAGAVTELDVLDAHLERLQAEKALREAEWDALLAEARYRRALGDPVWPGA